jgi:hypothetical protein
LITAWVLTLVILLGAAGMVKATWAEESPVLRLVPCSVLALGMIVELWLAQVWRLREEAWQLAYWRDIGQFQKQSQFQQLKRPEIRQRAEIAPSDCVSDGPQQLRVFLLSSLIPPEQSDRPNVLDVREETTQVLPLYIASIVRLWYPKDQSSSDQIRTSLEKPCRTTPNSGSLTR